MENKKYFLVRNSEGLFLREGGMEWTKRDSGYAVCFETLKEAQDNCPANCEIVEQNMRCL